MIEGSVACCMVILCFVTGTFFVVDSGTAVYMKAKLTHVNYLAAAFAAAHNGDSNLEEETTQFAKSAMNEMKIDSSNVVVHVSSIHLQDNPAVEVTITDEVTVLGEGTALPVKISLSDTEVVSW